MTIQSADPSARRRALWIITGALVLGCCGLLVFEFFRADFARWLERHADVLIAHPEMLLVSASILVSPVLALAAYLFRYARRVGESRRLPPPGYAVLVDTEVLEGAPAVRRARIISTMATILFCAAGALPIVLWHLFRSLGRTN